MCLASSEATGPLTGLTRELLLWNLPRAAADQYAEHLGLVGRASSELGVSGEDAREVLWRLARGNPEAIEAMAVNRMEEWLERVAVSVRDVLASYLLKKARESLDRVVVEEFAEELGRPERDTGVAPVEKPLYSPSCHNYMGLEPWPQMGGAWRSPRPGPMGLGGVGEPQPRANPTQYRGWGNANMLVYTFTLRPTSQLPREPWVGRWYAYSLPAYHYAVRAVHRKRSLEIGPGDILEEVMRG